MSGGQKTTQTSSNEPWAPARRPLQTGLTDAENLYRGGIGGAVNTMSNVTPYARQSTDAFSAGENMARANINGQGLSGQYQSIIGNGGYNQPQMDALAGIRRTATSTFNPYENEGFGSVLRQAQQGAQNGVNASASSAGRYGSGQHQGAVARAVGDVTGGLLNNEWNNFQNRQSGAQQAMFNAGQQGMQNIGSAYAGMQAPLDTLGSIGSANEDLYTRMLNDRNRIFDAQNNAPWDQLARLNAVAGGAGAMGGTSSGTATSPGANPFGTIAGGLLGLSGLFGG